MLKLFKPSDETKLVLNTLDPASLIRTLSYIGGGAHGKVYKIYNMLDDQVYSLKKIDLIDEISEISSEDTFSSLKDNWLYSEHFELCSELKAQKGRLYFDSIGRYLSL
jgi:hypothetical protein